jgi:arginyl-tRNA synthetase
MHSPLDDLRARLQTALVAAFGSQMAEVDPLLVPASNPKFGDYQSNAPLALAKLLGQSPRAIAEQILPHLDLDHLCDPATIAGPGFINFSLHPQYLSQRLQAILADPRLGITPVSSPRRVVVDFSSPNIAKEMHVGHLRSTIIGDCIARILEFLGQDVLRLNHVGDWGTQFGMLITYLREVCPSALTTSDALDLGDLVNFYKQAKARFDQDPSFQETARQEVVRLQSGQADSRRAWELLCAQSRREFQKLYDLLSIQLTERGESFYRHLLPAVVMDLRAAGLLVTDQGAECVFLEGFSNKNGSPQPLIIQKSDGGYNYATTDLAALRYRIQQDHADQIIYITDAGQATHFAQFLQVARRAGWIPASVEIVHVPFGLVQGEDGKKLKTRSGDTIRLQDLIDQAIARARADIVARLQEEQRQETPAFIDHVAHVLGIGAIKYADLSQNRTSNYIFSYDKMLALQGNTAPYLIYAYVRIQGINRKGQVEPPPGDQPTAILLQEETELALARHLIQLAEILNIVALELLPNRLCQYLFELSQKFNQFYDRCPILQADPQIRSSRLALSHLTANTLKLGLSLLGIQVLDRM